MPIKAIFPTGLTEITVNGLHQWDYGRKLEIHSGDLPALVEVHFACEGMQEAEVRSGAAVNGVIEVTIPDKCLEQTSPVIAWVYRIDETQGTTIKTITLIITPRARPQKSETVPAVISDKYTEMIGAINEQVEALKAGNVTVSNADHATVADSATNADHATVADSATIADVARRAQAANSATNADHATVADSALSAESTTTASNLELITDFIGKDEEYVIESPGLYAVLLGTEGVQHFDVIWIPNLVDNVDIISQYVRYNLSISGILGSLRAYNDAGHIRKVIKIADTIDPAG